MLRMAVITLDAQGQCTASVRTTSYYFKRSRLAMGCSVQGRRRLIVRGTCPCSVQAYCSVQMPLFGASLLFHAILLFHARGLAWNKKIAWNKKTRIQSLHCPCSVQVPLFGAGHCSTQKPLFGASVRNPAGQTRNSLRLYSLKLFLVCPAKFWTLAPNKGGCVEQWPAPNKDTCTEQGRCSD